MGERGGERIRGNIRYYMTFGDFDFMTYLSLTINNSYVKLYRLPIGIIDIHRI